MLLYVSCAISIVLVAVTAVIFILNFADDEEKTDYKSVSTEEGEILEAEKSPLKAGKWIWEESAPYLSIDTKDNWYDWDMAYIDILNVDGDEVTFEYSHQKGGMHLYFYDTCVGKLEENVVTAYTNAHKGGPPMAEFKITLYLNGGTIYVEAYNVGEEGVAFEGVFRKKENVFEYVSYKAVIGSFCEEDDVYSVYDIDGNGVSELIVKPSQSNESSLLKIYSVNMDDETVSLMGTYPHKGATLCENPEGNGFITYHEDDGKVWLETVTYNNGTFTGKTLTTPVSGNSVESPDEIKAGVVPLAECPVIKTGLTETLIIK